MASTYTSSIRLEKPAHNDYFNSWETVIDRIFDAIDDSIAGTTKITTTGGPTTLTAVNGGTDQARRAILLIDNRTSLRQQLSQLIAELVHVQSVDVWTLYDHQSVQQTSTPLLAYPAQQAFLDNLDLDNASVTTRILRSGTTPVGAMILSHWQQDPLLADAVASLAAIAVERARAVQRENRAEAERNTEQLRSAVLDGLAHGFKTPLTAIRTASSGLLAIEQLTPTQTELVTIIDDPERTFS